MIMSDKFFEAQINNFNFRYNGGNIIEVSKELHQKQTDWEWHIYGGGEEAYIKEYCLKNNLQ